MTSFCLRVKWKIIGSNVIVSQNFSLWFFHTIQSIPPSLIQLCFLGNLFILKKNLQAYKNLAGTSLTV